MDQGLEGMLDNSSSGVRGIASGRHHRPRAGEWGTYIDFIKLEFYRKKLHIMLI